MFSSCVAISSSENADKVSFLIERHMQLNSGCKLRYSIKKLHYEILSFSQSFVHQLTLAHLYRSSQIFGTWTPSKLEVVYHFDPESPDRTKLISPATLLEALMSSSPSPLITTTRVLLWLLSWSLANVISGSCVSRHWQGFPIHRKLILFRE